MNAKLVTVTRTTTEPSHVEALASGTSPDHWR